MKTELEDNLHKKFPAIFAGKKIPLDCECGNGWYNLIYELCRLLQYNTDKYNHPQVIMDQVKEKFGTLRFYYHTEDVVDNKIIILYNIGYIDGAISHAEAMSGKTCEECGNPGELKGYSTVKTLCDRCYTAT